MHSGLSTFHVTLSHVKYDTSSLNVGVKCPEPRKEQSGQEEAKTINDEVDDYYSVVKYLIAKGGRSAWLESETFIILTCQVSLNLCGVFGEPPKCCVPTLRQQIQKHWRWLSVQ